MRSSLLAATAVLSFALTSSATDIAKTCPGRRLCYSLNIPETTAQSGKGDIFFQIRASTDYQWAALGQGKGMQGANIFVVYQSSDGKNVTVSPRYGVGHEEPLWDSRADIELLGGSGVEDGFMTANIRCGDCDRWASGYMDFTADTGSWIWAYKKGSPLKSDDVEATISEHDSSSAFPWPWQRAKGGNSLNPFSDQNAVVSETPTTSVSDGNGFFITEPDWQTRVHGGLATLAFVILFPIGGILIRLANFRGGIWIHVGLQLVAWIAAFAALALGIRQAINLKLLVNAHPIIGLVLLVLLIGQPVYGFLHHRQFKKSGQRTTMSYVHLSIGRIVVFGGMVNGGLGIALAANVTRNGIIGYSVVAGIFAILYIAAIIWGERRRKRTKMGPTGFRTVDDKASLLSKRGDEAGLNQPGQGTELRQLWLPGHNRQSTEYAPLAVGDAYEDGRHSRAGSRAGSRATSPAPDARYSDRRTPSQDARARVSMN